MDRKQELYKQAIGLLKYIEIAIDNEDHYKIIRKGDFYGRFNTSRVTTLKTSNWSTRNFISKVQ